jgi:hypothetical protein
MSEAHGAKARLELARDILKIRESLTPDASIGLKHLAANRIGSIRRVLLGREGVGLIDEFLSPAIGGKKLQKIIDEADALPALERVAAITYAHAIASGLSAVATAEAKHGAWVERGSFASGKVNLVPQDADGLVDANIERGRIPKKIRDKLPDLKAMSTQALSLHHDALLKEHAPEVYALKKSTDDFNRQLLIKLEEAENEYRKINRALGREYEGGGAPGDKDLLDRLAPAKAKHDAAYKAYKEHWDGPLKQAMDGAREAVKAAQAKLQAPLIEAAKAFTESVVQASPVSAEQATAWADAQDITPQARARLKKIGYDLKKVRQDMAEFYRLSGGRVVKVKVHSKGDKRANATDIEDHGKEGVIHLDSRFDKRVLWHELAHHIEADPMAKIAAGKFIRRRSVDGKAHSLRSLTGSKGYRSNESAYKDHFFHEYVGKIYNDGITEVFSMGVESFSDPMTLGQRMTQDPETLEFVAGYLKQPIHPLAKAHMALRERLIDVTNEANEEASKGIEQLQAELAAKVSFTQDADTSWTGGGSISWYSGGGKQVGKFTESGFYLFEAKVRNPETKRQMLGFILYLPEQDGVNSLGHPRWSRRSHWDVQELPTKDLNVVKAAMLIRQKTGWFPGWYELNNADTLKKHLQE